MRDSDKSGYFAMAKFNFFFNHSITKFALIFQNHSDGSDICNFSFESMVTITHLRAEYYLQQNTFRQLFTGHVFGSWPMKRERKMSGMINIFISN